MLYMLINITSKHMSIYIKNYVFIFFKIIYIFRTRGVAGKARPNVGIGTHIHFRGHCQAGRSGLDLRRVVR